MPATLGLGTDGAVKAQIQGNCMVTVAQEQQFPLHNSYSGRKVWLVLPPSQLTVTSNLSGANPSIKTPLAVQSVVSLSYP